MKVICISIGTRGDIEPFVALAVILLQEGHQVICAFPAQFEKQAREAGATFYPLSREFIEMLDSSTGKMALGGGGSLRKKLKSYFDLYKLNRKVSFQLLQEQQTLIESEEPDLVLHSLKAFYPVYWHLAHPGKVVLVSPIPCVIHPVNEMSAIFLNGKNFGSRINRWSYKILRKLSMNYLAGQLKRMNIQGISRNALVTSWAQEKLLFTISPNLYPERMYWPDNVRVLGYLERNKTKNWNPPATLDEFLKKHQHPLFVTFGSMTNPEPEHKTHFVLKVLKEKGIPAIINTAAGGLTEPSDYDRENVYFVNDIPYDWIFPLVRAVIHHGGAGTTHLALKYGCPSMIVPHIPDQHLWNRIISKAGAGPRGPAITRFMHTDTESKIVDLYTSKYYLEQADLLSRKLKEEMHDQGIIEFLLRGNAFSGESETAV